ncbi:MAG: hypothetical protein E7445_06715 [Ruminococcaceae bacterium]|nr:hypothetical protein [Oscillospiraceae bacterium]
MIILWCLIAVAVLLLCLKLSSLRRRAENGRYAEESVGDRQERLKSDAAYEKQDLDSKSAYEMAEERTSMWP